MPYVCPDFTSTLASCVFDCSWYVRKHAASLAAAVIKQLITLNTSTSTSGEVRYVEQCLQISVHRAYDHLRQDFTVFMSPILCQDNELGGLQCTDEHMELFFEVMKHLGSENMICWGSILGFTPSILASRFLMVLERRAEISYPGKEMALLTVPHEIFENEQFRLEMQQQIIPFLLSMLERCNILAAVSIAAWALKG
jgi:hypothetical protein